MSALGLVYLAGAVVTLGATFWTAGFPRSVRDALAALALAVLWFPVLIGLTLEDTDADTQETKR